jgi:hypothetical protein
LVVKGGGLLVVNDLIRSEGTMTPARRDAIVSNTAKAIVGHGDEYLFARGAYHWSEVERMRRMAAAFTPAPPELKAHYAVAMRYRFQGDPVSAEQLLAIDGVRLRKVLCGVHGVIEGRRLGRRPGFRGYVLASFENDLAGQTASPRADRSSHALIAAPDGEPGVPFRVAHAIRAAGNREAVRALFPLIAYGKGSREDIGAARQILDTHVIHSRTAKLAWIRRWGGAFDPNVGFTIQQLGLAQVAA